MYLIVEKDFIESIKNNSFLRNKVAEFNKSIKEGKQDKFLNENPDFVQMMMNLAQSEKIKSVEEDE